jgi:hypothetical protein
VVGPDKEGTPLYVDSSGYLWTVGKFTAADTANNTFSAGPVFSDSTCGGVSTRATPFYTDSNCRTTLVRWVPSIPRFVFQSYSATSPTGFTTSVLKDNAATTAFTGTTIYQWFAPTCVSFNSGIGTCTFPQGFIGFPTDPRLFVVAADTEIIFDVPVPTVVFQPPLHIEYR